MGLIKTIFFLTLFLTFSCWAQVRVVLTAALADAHFEFRKNQYIETLKILPLLGYQNPYVIEALKKKGPTFLEDYTCNAFYSTADNPKFRNKGINEMRTLLEGITHFDFHPEDMIIKITGRYQPQSDYLFKIVENNPDIDAFVRVAKNGFVYTLGFAMRCKFLKEMINNLDQEEMERKLICIEEEVAKYVRKKDSLNFKVMYLEKLDIKGVLKFSSASNSPDRTEIF